MEHIQFEWDTKKNEINKKKHKISFEEAQTVFYDPEALVIDDPEHSEQEDRFIILVKRRICLWYVIVIGNLILLYVLYLQEKQLLQKRDIITKHRRCGHEGRI